MPVLRILRGEEPQGDYEFTFDEMLRGDGLIIGRSQTKCHKVLKPTSVSREHAAISYDGGGFWIKDLESTHGTVVNDRHLMPNVRHPLKSRDLIRIAGVVFQFLNDEDMQLPQVLLDDSIEDSSGSSDSLPGQNDRTKLLSKEKLKFILDLFADLREFISLAELMSNVLDRLLRMFDHADRVLLLLWEEEQENPTRTACRYRDKNTRDDTLIGKNLIQEIRQQHKQYLSTEKLTICAPLIVDGQRCLGVLRIDSFNPEKKLRRRDLAVLVKVATQLALAVENSILHEAAVRDRLMQFEMKMAREIQIGLLPVSSPKVERYEIFDFYEPALLIGGDYYDYVVLADGRVAMLVGDVVGKGVAAALLMARVSSELRVFLELGLSPVEVIERVNQRFGHRAPEGTFVTMVLLVLDPATNRLAVVNAGHPRPRVRRQTGAIEVIGDAEAATFLGYSADEQYAATEFTLEAGESLMLYTDGMYDARNAADRRFTEAALEAEFAKANGTAFEIGNHLVKMVDQHVANEPPADDRCLLCIRRAE